MIAFNPFNKNLKDIEQNDLSVLRDVTEGWYVEYKRQLVSVRSIAKSIAAFANHYGGWLFYGIEEASDGSNKAGSFPGLDQNEVTLLIEQIRNAAKDSISPSPYYEYRILTGPCSEIGLADDKSIIIVLIPSGPNPPYIHSDGRIYRRIADSSDPKPETDRFILDQLWQRGRDSQSKLSSFLETELTLSQGEDDVSYMELFLLPDPLEAAQQHSGLSFDQFVELMSDTKVPGISISFDNFYSMASGFIGRQINTNDPYGLVLTWKHYENGFSRVTFPFPSAQVSSINAGGWLHGYEQESAVIQLLQRRRGYSSSYLLDINQLIYAVIGTFTQQYRLMECGNIKGPLYAKAVLRNIWRRIPFLDSEWYIHFVSEHGFPIIQFTDEYAPPNTTYDSLVLIPENEIQEEEKDESENVERIAKEQGARAGYILGFILNAVGIPAQAVVSDKADRSGWWEGAQRVPSVSKHRTEIFEAW